MILFTADQSHHKHAWKQHKYCISGAQDISWSINWYAKSCFKSRADGREMMYRWKETFKRGEFDLDTRKREEKKHIWKKKRKRWQKNVWTHVTVQHSSKMLTSPLDWSLVWSTHYSCRSLLLFWDHTWRQGQLDSCQITLAQHIF